MIEDGMDGGILIIKATGYKRRRKRAYSTAITVKTAPHFLCALYCLRDWSRIDDKALVDASATLKVGGMLLVAFHVLALWSALMVVDLPQILLVGHFGASLLHTC